MGEFKGWLRRGPAIPPLSQESPFQDNLDQLVAEFLDKGVLRVDSPDGEGYYTFVKERSFKGFPVSIFWKGSYHGGTVHDMYSHPVYGPQVAFSPWPGGNDWGQGETAWGDFDAGALAATMISIIQTGYQIYMQPCGMQISSQKVAVST